MITWGHCICQVAAAGGGAVWKTGCSLQDHCPLDKKNKKEKHLRAFGQLHPSQQLLWGSLLQGAFW